MNTENTPTRNDPFAQARLYISPEVEQRFAVGMLSPRRQRMVEAYVREGTYAAAARASGMANATVKRLLEEDGDVRKAIADLVNRAATVSGVTLERVLAEYADLAFANIADVLPMLQHNDDPDAALAALAELPRSVTAAIHKIEVVRNEHPDGKVTGGIKLHMHNKQTALQDIGKMLSLFVDRVEITDTSTYGERIKAALSKLDEMKGKEGST